jgi:hypothetical protein
MCAAAAVRGRQAIQVQGQVEQSMYLVMLRHVCNLQPSVSRFCSHKAKRRREAPAAPAARRYLETTGFSNASCQTILFSLAFGNLYTGLSGDLPCRSRSSA